MTQPYPAHPQLQGNFAPIRMEADIDDLVIQGELPRTLEVEYYRNGPDPQFPPRGDHHWFSGDGMLHRFEIADGRVRYRNRWLRTVKWHKEREAGRSLFGAFNPMDTDPSVAGIETDGLANTNVIWHGGRLLALEEGHAPFEVDPRTLESIGPWRFGGTFEGPMTAHPKIDPVTGEMIFFGYMVDGMLGKGLSYHVVDADGVLTRSERFEAPISSMVHDFIVTSEHVIFPILPLTGSIQRATRGEPAFAWEPDKGSHIGVMPRDGSIDDIRWYETDPCYVFHPMNAMTLGNTIRAHVMQFEEAPLFPHADGSAPDPKKANARLCEWEIDLADNARTVKRTYLDDITGEFPRLDERRAGLEYRHGYYAASTGRGGSMGFNALVHHDFATNGATRYELDDGDYLGEPVFVPETEGAEEGAGFLLSLIYRGVENRSDLAVFDARDVARGPVALGQLPHRVPYGFHGNWRYLNGS